MFVKLNDASILDMATGTLYRWTQYIGKDSTVPETELEISFNGNQDMLYCSGLYADCLWEYLDKAALKFGDDPKEG